MFLKRTGGQVAESQLKNKLNPQVQKQEVSLAAAPCKYTNPHQVGTGPAGKEESMKKYYLTITLLAVFLSALNVQADQMVIHMYKINDKGTGAEVGTINASETPYGTLFTPDLKGLPPGLHGFHVHEKGDCGPKEKNGVMTPGLAAGGHYDPLGTGTHKGPYQNGHLGDLPALCVAQDGQASLPVLAPRVRLMDIKGRALIIHAGGDNYSDHPELGGGGPRWACGVAQ